MTNFSHSIRARNLKCFSEKFQGFEELKLVNIIIGKNNSGKSSLLNLVEFSTTGNAQYSSAYWHNEMRPEFSTVTSIIEADLVQIFGAQYSILKFPNTNISSSEILDAKVNVSFTEGGRKFVDLKRSNGDNFPPHYASTIHPHLITLINNVNRLPLYGKYCIRLGAERDIVPEVDLDLTPISNVGNGCTNAIQHFLNKSHLKSKFVKKDLLDSINSIFGPDTVFTDIVCKFHNDSKKWEIYLVEEGKGPISLSLSGSGLKTVILSLSYIHLIPQILNRPLSEFVFCFEELENNLHPALLRRLLDFLAKKSIENSFPIFLTTHSSIAIDMFSKNPNSQIIHVTHNGSNTTCRTIRTYIDNMGVIDDLDVRASDLLQSNGIIWVEGPSDRVYLNRWISLWSDGLLNEGTHYQCVFYGGRLLAHISASEPERDSNGVEILKVNRNAIMLIDSDKKFDGDDINQTKKRIKKEIEEINGLCWVTHGKEIENYTPTNAIKRLLNIGGEIEDQEDIYENFFEYLDRLSPGKGKVAEKQKALFAEQISLKTTKEDLEANQYLREALDKLCNHIKAWNNI